MLPLKTFHQEGDATGQAHCCQWMRVAWHEETEAGAGEDSSASGKTMTTLAYSLPSKATGSLAGSSGSAGPQAPSLCCLL